MGWGRCGTDSRGRPIGYYHAASCDHPGCRKRIDRGLAYACGGMHGLTHVGGDDSLDGFDLCCEGYFCSEHLRWPCFEHEDCADLETPQLCFACADEAERRYRTDPEWRSLWPTDAPPLECDSRSKREALGRETGPARKGESGGAESNRPKDTAQ